MFKYIWNIFKTTGEVIALIVLALLVGLYAAVSGRELEDLLDTLLGKLK